MGETDAGLVVFQRVLHDFDFRSLAQGQSKRCFQSNAPRGTLGLRLFGEVEFEGAKLRVLIGADGEAQCCIGNRSSSATSSSIRTICSALHRIVVICGVSHPALPITCASC